MGNKRKRSAKKTKEPSCSNPETAVVPRGHRWTSNLAETVDWEMMITQDHFRAFQAKAPVGNKLGDCVMRRVFDLLATQDVQTVTQFYGLGDDPENNA